MLRLLSFFVVSVILLGAPASAQETWKPERLGVRAFSHVSPAEGACAMSSSSSLIEINTIRALGGLDIQYVHDASVDYQRYVNLKVHVRNRDGGPCTAQVDLEIIRFTFEKIELGSERELFLPLTYCDTFFVKTGPLNEILSATAIRGAIENCLKQVDNNLNRNSD